MKTAIYCRAASSSQGWELDIQKAALERLARERQYEVVTAYSDCGSGLDPNRPGLQSLMLAASQGKFDVLLLMNLNRLSRNTTDTIRILRQLRDNGIRVESPSCGDINMLAYTSGSSLLDMLEKYTEESYENTDR